MTVGQAVCQLLCRYTQSTLAASCVCWIVPIAACTLSKELVGVHVWNAPDQWYTILLVSADCCFLRFSECFPVISGFCIAVQYRFCYCFSTIFWVLASGLPSAKFLSWFKPPVTSLHLIKARLYCRYEQCVGLAAVSCNKSSCFLGDWAML